MRLRTSILFALLLFAVLPTLLFVSLSLPLMLDELQYFYNQAHLQALRADFRDLDEHLAGRREMTRVLTRLPEPGLILGEQDAETARIDEGRTHYTEWVNGVFGTQLDVVAITFLDAHNQPGFWLQRKQPDASLISTQVPPELPQATLLEYLTNTDHFFVAASPVYIGTDYDGRPSPRLHLLAPVYDQQDAQIATVIVTIDIGGLADAYPDTLWVDSKGAYIGATKRPTNAFQDFPNLDKVFAAKRTDLLKDPTADQMIWVPMFRTTGGENLWVGRPVGRLPIAALWQKLAILGLAIAVILLVLVWLVALRVSRGIAAVGQQLGDGVYHIVEEHKEVNFDWKRPVELKELGQNLTRLSQTHARDRRNLLAHTRELEDSNRFKSEFLANVSHELKTPLNSILILSRLLSEDSRLDRSQRERASVMNSAGRDLHRLIENILELAMLERMDQQPILEEVSLRQLINDTVELMRPQFEQKALWLKTSFEPQVPALLVTDAHKLRQILRNLLSNALKFTYQGGVKVQVETNFSSDEKQSVLILVCDTGMGIAPQEQQQIFEAFRQADGSIRRSFGGTGLGLNISKRLAHLIGGSITLESKLGQGSTFMLRLPLKYAPSLDQSQASEYVSDPDIKLSPKGSDANFRGRSVLIIDNDLDHQIELSRIFSRWQINVVIATEEDEIREAIHDNPSCLLALINISLCDLHDCDSIGIIRDNNSKCTLIALREVTQQVDATVRNRFDAELTAPFDAGQLKKLIEHQLKV